MGPELPLAIELPARGSRQLVKTLHAQLRGAIVDGRLRAGLKLPSTRSLARQYGVSRNCVIAAYDLLLAEGYLTAQPRGGTYVANAVRRMPHERGPAPAVGALRSRPAPCWRGEPAVVRFRSTRDFEFDFGVGVPDVSAFPFDAWRRLAARTARAFARAPEGYGEAEGATALRAAIARHVSMTRAVACNQDDIVVTSGAQQAFDLLARLFVTAGKSVVAIEEPGYPPLRWAFESYGAKLAPIPVDAEGIIVERIPRNARVVCVTPSHQFPMGYVMSMRRRAALLEFAHRNRAIVIEDDYDGEFTHTDRPLDALQTLDRSQSVFYVGTFSKCLFPALRLGYVVVPDWAREPLIAAKQRCDWHAALPTQDALAAFIADGHLARHVRRMRGLYRERRNALIRSLERLPDVEVVPAQAGLHVTVLLHGRKSGARIAAAAANAGVRVHSLDWFALSNQVRNGLVCGLGAIPTDRVDAAVKRLAGCVRSRAGA